MLKARYWDGRASFTLGQTILNQVAKTYMTGRVKARRVVQIQINQKGLRRNELDSLKVLRLWTW